jgi:xylulokinase
MAVFLGLDIGTTSTIGILIDEAGRTHAVASRPVDLHSPHANWAEEDPAQWWENVGEITRDLLRTAALAPDSVAGVGVTGMLPALILLDAAGHPVRRSIQQNDARAIEELHAFAARRPEAEFVGLTATGYSQQLIGPKLAWIARHEPDAHARAKALVGASDFITHKLTGSLQVEHNWALESGFVNLDTGAYDPDLIAQAGIDARLLQPIRRSEEVVGAVTAEASNHTGLAAGTPVVAGCADHVASAFVCGASRNGDLVVKFGGAADILLSSDRPVRDRRLFLDHHIVPGLWFPNGCMAAGGNLLNWVIAHFGKAEAADAKARGVSPHHLLDDRAASLDTELLLLPYVLGEKTPLMDPNARGTLVGLGLHHDLAHIWRAALEGIVFGMRHHVETFEDCGLSVSRVLAADGGATSDVWLQIAADVLDRPVQRVDRHPGSCLGAAFVAAVGTGAITSWDRIGDYVAMGRTFTPRPVHVAAYNRKYGLWRETYDRLRTLYPKLQTAVV